MSITYNETFGPSLPIFNFPNTLKPQNSGLRKINKIINVLSTQEDILKKPMCNNYHEYNIMKFSMAFYFQQNSLNQVSENNIEKNIEILKKNMSSMKIKIKDLLHLKKNVFETLI